MMKIKKLLALLLALVMILSTMPATFAETTGDDPITPPPGGDQGTTPPEDGGDVDPLADGDGGTTGTYTVEYSAGEKDEDDNLLVKLPTASFTYTGTVENPTFDWNPTTFTTDFEIVTGDVDAVTALTRAEGTSFAQTESVTYAVGEEFVFHAPTQYVYTSTANSDNPFIYTFMGWACMKKDQPRTLEIYQPGEPLAGAEENATFVVSPIWLNAASGRDCALLMIRFESDATDSTTKEYILTKLARWSDQWGGEDDDYRVDGVPAESRPFDIFLNTKVDSYEYDAHIAFKCKTATDADSILRHFDITRKTYRLDNNTSSSIAVTSQYTHSTTGEAHSAESVTIPFGNCASMVYATAVYVPKDMQIEVDLGEGWQPQYFDANGSFMLPYKDGTVSDRIEWIWTSEDGQDVRAFYSGNVLTVDRVNATTDMGSPKIVLTNRTYTNNITYYTGLWETDETTSALKVVDGMFVEAEGDVQNMPADEPDKVVVNGSFVMPADAPTRDGYRFTGWFLSYVDNYATYQQDVLKGEDGFNKGYILNSAGTKEVTTIMNNEKIPYNKLMAENGKEYACVATWDLAPTIQYHNAADENLPQVNLSDVPGKDLSQNILVTTPNVRFTPLLNTADYKFSGWRASWNNKLYDGLENTYIPIPAASTAGEVYTLTAEWEPIPYIRFENAPGENNPSVAEGLKIKAEVLSAANTQVVAGSDAYINTPVVDADARVNSQNGLYSDYELVGWMNANGVDSTIYKANEIPLNTEATYYPVWRAYPTLRVDYNLDLDCVGDYNGVAKVTLAENSPTVSTIEKNKTLLEGYGYDLLPSLVSANDNYKFYGWKTSWGHDFSTGAAPQYFRTSDSKTWFLREPGAAAPVAEFYVPDTAITPVAGQYIYDDRNYAVTAYWVAATKVQFDWNLPQDLAADAVQRNNSLIPDDDGYLSGYDDESIFPSGNAPKLVDSTGEYVFMGWRSGEDWKDGENKPYQFEAPALHYDELKNNYNPRTMLANGNTASVTFPNAGMNTDRTEVLTAQWRPARSITFTLGDVVKNPTITSVSHTDSPKHVEMLKTGKYTLTEDVTRLGFENLVVPFVLLEDPNEEYIFDGYWQASWDENVRYRDALNEGTVWLSDIPDDVVDATLTPVWRYVRKFKYSLGEIDGVAVNKVNFPQLNLMGNTVFGENSLVTDKDPNSELSLALFTLKFSDSSYTLVGYKANWNNTIYPAGGEIGSDELPNEETLRKLPGGLGTLTAVWARNTKITLTDKTAGQGGVLYRAKDELWWITPMGTDNYWFRGWELQNAAAGEKTLYVPGESYTATAQDVEFVAKWDPKYTMTFKDGIGDKDITLSAEDVALLEQVKSNETNPERFVLIREIKDQNNNYTFLGWDLSWDDSDKTYSALTYVTYPTEVPEDRNLVITAVWGKNHKLTFDFQGNNTDTVPPPEGVNELIVTPIRSEFMSACKDTDNYMFVGYRCDWDAEGVIREAVESGIEGVPPYATFENPGRDGKVTAVWKRKSTVTFEKGDNPFDYELPDAIHNSLTADTFRVPMAPHPVDQNGAAYEFKGWKASWDGKIYQQLNGTLMAEFPEGGGTMVGQWEYLPLVTLKDELNNTEHPMRYVQNATVTLPQPAHEGHYFRGWKLGETLLTGDRFVVTGAVDVTLTAVWVEKTQITINGNTEEIVTNAQRDKVTLPAYTPAADEVLVGWKASWDAEAILAPESEVDIPAGKGEVTLTPVTVKKSVVSFENGDAAVNALPAAVQNFDGKTYTGETFVAPAAPTPVDARYVFLGWSFDGETLYQAGDIVSFPDTGNAAMKAIWNARVKISYESDPQEVNATLPQIHYVDRNTSVALTAPTAEAPWIFQHWTVNGVKVEGKSYPIADVDVVFTAVWDRKVEITASKGVNAECAETMPTIAPDYAGEELSIPAALKDTEKYIFTGWLAAWTGKVYQVGEKAVYPAYTEPNKQLTAVWKAKPVVTLVNGGEETSAPYYVGTEIPLKALDDTETHAFVGWQLEGQSGYIASYTVVDADVRIVAVWQKKTVIALSKGDNAEYTADLPAAPVPAVPNADMSIPAALKDTESYTFAGWKASWDDATYEAKAEAKYPDKDGVLTAVWKAKPVVTLVNGGEETSAPYYVGTEIPLKALDDTETHAFVGWQLEGQSGYITSYTVMDADVRIVAVWKAKTVVTIINLHEAQTLYRNKGDVITLEKDLKDPSDKAYFTGWKVNGTGEYLTDYRYVVGEEDVRLIAMWSGMHEIVIDNGTTERVEYGEPGDVVVLPTDLTEEKRYFLGWTVNGAGAYITEYTVGTEDVRLVAMWENKPVVTTVVNGETKTEYVMPGDTVTLEKQDKLEGDDKGLYVFQGYEIDGKPVENLPYTYTVSEDVKIEVIWKKKTEIIITNNNADYNGAMPSDPEAKLEGETLVLPAALADFDDYVFEGWLATWNNTLYAGGATIAYPETDGELVAKWARRVTVSFDGAVDADGNLVQPVEGLDSQLMTVPGEPAGRPDGQQFDGWVASWDGKVYKPGEKIPFPGGEGEMSMRPQWSDIPPTTVYPDYDDVYDPFRPDGEQGATGLGEGDCYVVLCRVLNVRQMPTTSSARVGKLTRGTIVHGTVHNGWVEIEYNGEKAYVSASYVERTEENTHIVLTEPEMGSVICRRLNVRTGVGTSYKKLGMLSRGTEVRVLEICNGWYRIEYPAAKDGTAWVCAKYIELK